MLLPRATFSVFEHPVAVCTPARIPCFFKINELTHISQILEQPYCWFIESGDNDAIQNDLYVLLNERPDFAVNMTTASAYRHTVALAIADSIHNRFGIQKSQTSQIHTCIQEALMNAIIHGNLELQSNFKTLESQQEHFIKVENKIYQSEHGRRRITIAAWQYATYFQLAVTDQGKGFVLPPEREDLKLPHGRGIKLIRSIAQKIWVGDDKRTLWMQFNTGNL